MTDPSDEPTTATSETSDQPGTGAAPEGEQPAPAQGESAAEAPAVDDAATTANPGEPTESEDEPLTVEGLVETLEAVTVERDAHLDSLLRLQAEFENYRKAVAKRETDARERANEGLATELLPILDACDGAVANGSEDVVPVQTALVAALGKQGLTPIDSEASPFDPELHEAVMHEEAEGDDGPVVAEVLRTGYQWKGRTLRAAMVRVRG